MQNQPKTNNRAVAYGRLYITIFLLCFTGITNANAYPMPNSVVLLDVKGDKVTAELQLPLNELGLAFGHGCMAQLG